MSQARIAVSALTRNRPTMFARLCSSFARMQIPDGVEVIHVFVENGPEATVTATVDRLRQATGRTCHLEVEPRLGIPFGRNAALEKALAEGATHLAFVDDDEIVPAEWLCRLWAGFQAASVELVTGPVWPEAEPGAPLTYMQHRVLLGMQMRMRGKLLKRQADAMVGQLVPAATNNWLCDLFWVGSRRLRFREEIGLGTGSDTTFWRDFRAAGGSSAWVHDAMLIEHLPRSRLSLGYQIRRCRDQSSMRARSDKRPRMRSQRVIELLSCVSRCTYGALRMLIGLFGFNRTLIAGARDMGLALGKMDAIIGRRWLHYAAPRAESVSPAANTMRGVKPDGAPRSGA